MTADLPGFTRRGGTALLALASLLILSACGGGSGAAAPAPGPGLQPPENLTYSAPTPLYRTDGPITPNVASVEGGAVDTWAITPTLPAGLSFDTSDGTITGSPVAPSSPQVFTVTASNTAGDTSADVTIEVKWAEFKSLDPQAGLTDDDFRHFLRRTHWGVTDARMNAIQTSGLPAFIDAMLVWPAVGTQQFEIDARALLEDPDDPVGQEGLFPSRTDLTRWHIYLLMNNPNTFQEVLAFFWHDHFATSSEVLGGGRL
ncbi:MAG: Ig domain-containing protein, partial [Planctomycetota bacterium]